MSRRYDEQIQVMTIARAGALARPGGAEPERFLWRGRLYLVREVLSCWQERQPWWTQQAAAAVQGREDRSSAEDSNSDGGPDDESSRTVAADRLTVLADGSERQVWRVRASAGRLAVMGTYDLVCQSWVPELSSAATTPSAAPTPGSSGAAASAASGGQQSHWWLLQVSD